MDGEPFGHGSPKKESLAAQLRKSNKPLMEKRRRERINSCLDQLKSILMEVTKKESSYYSKLEKADILEMTVKYLKNLKRQTVAGSHHSLTDIETLSRYVAGFNECTKEVTNYLTSVSGLNDEARSCILRHLANSLQRSHVALNDRVVAKSAAATASTSLPAGSVYVLGGGQGGASGGLQTVSVGQMQVLPARLANGEVVFLLASPQTGNESAAISTSVMMEAAVSARPTNGSAASSEQEEQSENSRMMEPADSTYHQPTSSTFDDFCSSADSTEVLSLLPSIDTMVRFSEAVGSEEINTPTPRVRDSKPALTTVTTTDATSYCGVLDVKLFQHHLEPTSSTRMKEEDLLNNNGPDDVKLNPMWRPW